ncbi:MAG: UbiD family decarboxylase, partial [Nannocystaceae bacterium]
VVDEDVDPSDLREVMAAMALQTQADTKVVILPDQQGTPLDPSCPREDGRSAKMGIDATRPLAPARPVTRNRIPAEVLDAVDLAEILGRK